MKRLRWVIVGALVGVIGAWAGIASAGPTLVVEEAWARAAPSGDLSAAYMVLGNSGDQDDTLVAASCDCAEAAELHKSTMISPTEMRMEAVTEIRVRAGGIARLEPGGFHIMLIKTTRDLAPGSEISLKLTFAQSGEIVQTITVVGP